MNMRKIFFVFILSLTLIPIQNLFGFEMPVLFLLIPLWLFLFVFMLLGRVKLPKFSRAIIIIFILIIIEIFISTLVGSTLILGNFSFPNDVIHYVARFLTYLFFSTLFYYKRFSTNFFIKTFMIVLILGMLIGVLQWLPWPGQKILLQLYPYRDGGEQLALLGRDLSVVRIHGWAQFATANGALGMMAFVVALTVFIYMNKYKLASVILMILSILNIVISQARAGMLAFVFAIIMMYFVHMYITKRPFKSSLKYIILLVFSTIVLRILYINQNPFLERIIYRWDALFETSGGARVDQIEYGLSLITNPLTLLYGISRAVQSEYVFHIEVEPVNIFVLNGLIGFILQYGLVVILLIYFAKNLKLFSNMPQVKVLLVSSFVVLASYQVFSIAYFFYREARVGLIPWILFGVTVGVVEYYKKQNKGRFD